MNDLRVTVIQSDIIWENPDASKKHFDAHLQKIDGPTDLVVLPEMFTTGFSMEPERIAEEYNEENSPSINWMKSWSKNLNAVITGSISFHENGKFYNRLIWAKPDGSISSYDKRHLFRMASEHQHYTTGENLLIENIKGWKICPLICYDLRFPVWSRNRLVKGKPFFDVQLYVANWPEVRREPWKKLLLARAIENQCYLVGVNRVGSDGNGHQYVGDSSFINPKGEYMQEFVPGKEEVRTQVFSFDELEEFRKRFPVLDDADSFQIS